MPDSACKRTDVHKPENIEIKWLLAETNQECVHKYSELLGLLQDQLSFPSVSSAPPPIFIVGPPRSGTTLLYQLLAQHLNVGYISNVLARFWAAPILGALICEKILHLSPPGSLKNDLGRTEHPGGVHEFGYFWRRYFDDLHTDWADHTRLGMEGSLLREITALTNIFERRMLFKSLTCSLRISPLYKLFPGAIFVDVRRSGEDIAASILRSRRRCCSDISKWWSLRPRELHRYRNLPVCQQIKAQIETTWEQIESDCTAVGAKRLVVHYESLCANPEKMVEMISSASGVPYHSLPNEPLEYRTGISSDEPLAEELRNLFP